MKVYKADTATYGHRGVVVMDEKGAQFLNPHRSKLIWNHSPDGFNWGYGGSGPAQLALAIMLDVFNDAQMAQRHYQAFKDQVIAGLPTGRAWQITEEEVRAFVLARQAAA